MCIIMQEANPLCAICAIHALNCRELKLRGLTIIPPTIIPPLTTLSRCSDLATLCSPVNVIEAFQPRRCFARPENQPRFSKSEKSSVRKSEMPSNQNISWVVRFVVGAITGCQRSAQVHPCRLRITSFTDGDCKLFKDWSPGLLMGQVLTQDALCQLRGVRQNTFRWQD